VVVSRFHSILTGKKGDIDNKLFKRNW